MKKAFTLLEVIIVIFISTLIFTTVTGLYIVMEKIYSRADERAEITQNGRVILDRITRELRQSQKISTQLPITPDSGTPNELQFQNGHNPSVIKYIRYYLENNTIRRQEIAYYFPTSPEDYVYKDATDRDPPHDPPIEAILEDKLVGEYIDDIEFWGDKLININLYLSKNNQSIILFTNVFGRNL